MPGYNHSIFNSGEYYLWSGEIPPGSTSSWEVSLASPTENLWHWGVCNAAVEIKKTTHCLSS